MTYSAGERGLSSDSKLLRLRREDLYDLVWAEPVTKVAEEFGAIEVEV